MVLATINEDLAKAEGVDLFRVQAVFVCMLIIIVAVAFKLVGSLLITALMIMPAASARQFVRSPEKMALWACAIGIFSVIYGHSASVLMETQPGPTIVVVMTILFIFSAVYSLLLHKKR
jgi:zinc transport system permease protein